MVPLISRPDSKERAEAWQRLQELEDRALHAGLRRLTSTEVLELGRLYRRAAADLAQARSLGLDPHEAARLNSLVGRAYGLIYTPERGGAASVAEFFTHEFPRCFRRNFIFILAAFLVTVVGALIGLFATLSNREAVDVLMGPGAASEMERLGQRNQVGHDWLPSAQRPIESTYLPTHNMGVAFAVFGGGLLLGLGTLALLIENGIMLGAAAVAVARYHTSLEFWGFVAPHGVIELPAIFVAGGAGFMLAYALVNPGEYSRRTALALAAREAVVLVLGVVAMLAIAGVTEAFFSPSLISPYVKFLVAAFNLTAEISYFALAGRSEGGVQAAFTRMDRMGIEQTGTGRQWHPVHPGDPVHPVNAGAPSEHFNPSSGVRPLPPL